MKVMNVDNQHRTQVFNVNIFLVNLGTLALDLVLLSPFGILSAAMVVWYAIRIRNQSKKISEHTYCRRLREIDSRRDRWNSDIASLELDVYGETYDHDRSYLGS